jgi:hypothetical protein
LGDLVELVEIEPEGPKRGTLAWLLERETVDVGGIRLPDVHRVPEGAEIGEEDGYRCRVVIAGSRCNGTRVKAFGVCVGHAGGGDPEAASLRGHAGKARIRQRRELLGIGPRTAANPRALARLAAQERAEEIAAALVDGPLDARDITALERQTAVIRALDATYPLQSATFEVEIPADAEAVASLGWGEMQALAARLLEG